MKTDKKTLDALFKEREKAEKEIYKAASQHLLQILKDNYEIELDGTGYGLDGARYMRLSKLWKELEKKDSRFKHRDYEAGLKMLERQGYIYEPGHEKVTLTVVKK